MCLFIPHKNAYNNCKRPNQSIQNIIVFTSIINPMATGPSSLSVGNIEKKTAKILTLKV
jgi:hypothetical protein